MSIINQYTSSSKTLNKILRDADNSGNQNGKIDTDTERDIVNKEAKALKEQLAKEGVILNWCNEYCTSIDFKKENSVFNLLFNGDGNLESIGNYKEEGKHEEIAEFFGLEPTMLSQIKNFFGFGEVIYEDNSGNKLAPWGQFKLWNIKTIPGEPFSK